MIRERAHRPRWAAALFDLDGTLIDTRPGMREALAAAFAEVTGRDPGVEGANLSLPLAEMIASADPSITPDVLQQVAAAFRRHYDAGAWMTARVYPGAQACLEDLRSAGVRAFVVTNKRSSAAERLLAHFALAPSLEGIMGQPETGEPVPKTVLAARCLTGAGIDPDSAVAVGDSDQDAAMAASQGMMFVAVTTGAGPLARAVVGGDRVEVASLADAAAFVLAGAPGRRS